MGPDPLMVWILLAALLVSAVVALNWRSWRRWWIEPPPHSWIARQAVRRVASLAFYAAVLGLMIGVVFPSVGWASKNAPWLLLVPAVVWGLVLILRYRSQVS